MTTVILAVILIVLLFVDGWSTIECIKLGMKEQNRLLLYLARFADFDIVIWMTRGVGVVAAAVLGFDGSDLALVLLAALTAWFTYVVQHNVRQLRMGGGG